MTWARKLLIKLVVTPADEHDRNMIAPLLAIASKRFPSLEIIKRSDAIKWCCCSLALTRIDPRVLTRMDPLN
jgi:hypothetical protein